MTMPVVCNRRVLVIDDNPSIHEDFRKVLGCPVTANLSLEAGANLLFGTATPAAPRQYFDVESAFQGQQGLERVHTALLAGRPYAVAFVDMRMPPGWDGLETVERLWQEDPNVQVVICSAYGEHDWTDLVVRLGEPDNLLVIKKPFEPIEVLQSANALTRKWQNEAEARAQLETLRHDVTQRTLRLEAAERQIGHLATHDSLTGLPNRALLEDRLGQTIAQAKRDSSEFALLLFDLDRFKSVNESLGHRGGDEVLKLVAERLRGAARAADTIARLGADEFVLVMPGIKGAQEPSKVAQRALQAVASPMMVQGIDVRATASVGIAHYPSHGITAAALFHHVDAALQHAKRRGGGRLEHFVPGMSLEIKDKIQLESELRQGLEEGQLELHYQPKVDVQSGAVHSAEALIRWRHPLHGLVSPDRFIPLAEETGFIHAIGAWVIREACRQARAWLAGGLPSVRIAVNLSPIQFRHGNLLAVLRLALDEHDLPPGVLEVELTETAVMSDAEASVTILNQISEMGILISVDDFGTGYSSMSYLRRFPVDKLKIDRVFIREIASCPDDAAIVRAIVSLAHSLRLKVVAEGVETREQLEFLRSIGCDHYQGYLYSPAVPADEFARLLRTTISARDDFMQTAMRTHSKLAAYRR